MKDLEGQATGLGIDSTGEDGSREGGCRWFLDRGAV